MNWRTRLKELSIVDLYRLVQLPDPMLQAAVIEELKRRGVQVIQT